jgi:hypothetical protein
VSRLLALTLIAAALASCTTTSTPSDQATGLSAATATQAAAECHVASNPATVLPGTADALPPADAVSLYLDGGGDPAALAAALYDRGWVSPTSKVVWTDIDGDGGLDFAAGLTAGPGAQGITHAGSVFVWQCRGGRYDRSEVAPSRPGFSPPALREARDVTGDRIAELIVAYPVCGAHTCFAQFGVFQPDGAMWIDRFQGASDDMPSPELSVQVVEPGSAEILRITATGSGSVGAGPYRVWSRAWSWDPEVPAFIPDRPEVEEPRFRIHALHDADDALLRGELAVALALYERVIEDDQLLDWPSAGDRRPEVAAYAAYRRVLTLLLDGDPGQAQGELNRRLTGAEPAEVAYGELARRLIAAHAGGTLAEACRSASSFVGENSEAMLAPLDFGYANRAYTASDICPEVLQ